MGTQVRLVSIPSTDVEFGEHARAVLETLEGRRDEVARAELERQLRRRYPGAEVRRRDDLASFGPTDDVVWYAINREHSGPIHASVEIPAPRELVFDVYLDRYPAWQTAVEVRPTDPIPGALAAYAATYEIFGRRFDGRFDVVEVDRPRLIRVEALGASGIAAWYLTSFREAGAGTLVHVVGDYELPSRLLPEVQRFIVERVIARDIARAHESLVDLVDRETYEANARDPSGRTSRPA
ncbi:MAG TPA: SRPBCC family protein [Candidatus Limnocylindrales bacterium]